MMTLGKVIKGKFITPLDFKSLHQYILSNKDQFIEDVYDLDGIIDFLDGILNKKKDNAFDGISFYTESLGEDEIDLRDDIILKSVNNLTLEEKDSIYNKILEENLHNDLFTVLYLSIPIDLIKFDDNKDKNLRDGIIYSVNAKRLNKDYEEENVCYLQGIMIEAKELENYITKSLIITTNDEEYTEVNTDEKLEIVKPNTNPIKSNENEIIEQPNINPIEEDDNE